MEKKKALGITNMNGMQDDADTTCGLNDMNCLGGQKDTTCGLNDKIGRASCRERV